MGDSLSRGNEGSWEGDWRGSNYIFFLSHFHRSLGPVWRLPFQISAIDVIINLRCWIIFSDHPSLSLAVIEIKTSDTSLLSFQRAKQEEIVRLRQEAQQLRQAVSLLSQHVAVTSPEINDVILWSFMSGVGAAVRE